MVRTLDDFFKIVNKIQLEKVKVKILATDLDSHLIIENILNDSKLSFDKREMKKGILYTIHPNMEEVIIEPDVEELEDEFLENGQLF